MEERHAAAPRLRRGEPPRHAGLSPTFCGRPLVLDPAALAGVGACGRPHLRSGDPFAVLDVVDHGDAEPAPGDLERAALDILTGMAMRRAQR